VFQNLLPHRLKVQKIFIQYTQSLLTQVAKIEELIGWEGKKILSPDQTASEALLQPSIRPVSYILTELKETTTLVTCCKELLVCISLFLYLFHQLPSFYQRTPLQFPLSPIPISTSGKDCQNMEIGSNLTISIGG